LQQSAVTLQNVASEFHQSGEAIQHLAEQKVGAHRCIRIALLPAGSPPAWQRTEASTVHQLDYSHMQTRRDCCAMSTRPCWSAGQPMLLPLSQSLYVEGELADADSVLLDIGTGYYLEVRTAGAADIIHSPHLAGCNRRGALSYFRGR
jgi:Prefoldin subunit